MAMQLNKEALVPILESAGFKKTNHTVWMIDKEGTPYGVDFSKHVIFRYEGTERIFEDTEDPYLNTLKEMCVNGTVGAGKGAACEICNTTVSFSLAESARKMWGQILCAACCTKANAHGGIPPAVLIIGWEAYEKQKQLEETPDDEQKFADDVQEPEESPRENKAPENNKPVDEPVPDIPQHVAVYSIPLQPIRGIKGLIPQLCECGHIKIGIKGKTTTSGKGKQFRPPQKLDHFVITTMQKENDDFVEDTAIMAKLGPNCTEIPVILLYDEPSLNFFTSLAHYDSAQCQCRGNGEIAVKADGTQIPCNPDTCDYALHKLCKPNGVLSVVLQDAPRVGGVWKFRTTGWNSIRNLMSSIEFIHGMTGGRLAGLPLMLTLQPKTTVIPGTRNITTIYMVNIEYRGTIGDLLNCAATRLATPDQIARIEAKAATMLALPESPEECRDVQEEFYSETVVTA
ncbi:recombination directionality factor [Methanolobus psychrotolerans]|uniref:recombination directionality factor n=1 Tax=Methanolobus psychrotolerans TaxID=1874706 RepID=UPI000B91A8D1|nr:hypothetical protein [Methanolobus psychrotolerans]